MEAFEIDHSIPEVPVDGIDLGLAPLRARLMRHARLIVGDRDLAEDLVQDTLVAVLVGRAAIRGEASVTTWAVAILKNKVADWYRSPTRRLMTHFADGGEDGSGDELASVESSGGLFGASLQPFPAPDRALEQRQLDQAVDRCVARLPVQARQVFTMREQMGLETDEVCLRLDITQEHCRVLLHRARAALRAFLGERFFASSRGESPCRGKNRRYAARPRNDRLSDCTT